MHRLITNPIRTPLLLLIALFATGAASLHAQDAFVLSTQEDFSTDDRLFGREDILYMRIEAPSIDFLALSANAFYLTPAGTEDANAAGFYGSLENNFDGTYTGKIDLSLAESDAAAWTWSARLEDDRGNEFQAEADVFIGDPDSGVEIEVKGVVEEVGEAFFVLYGRKLLVTETTEIVTEAGELLRLGDLAAGDEVSALIHVAPGAGEGEAQLFALRVVRLAGDRKDEVVATGVVQEVGDRVFVVQNLRFEVTETTKFIGPNEEEIGFSDIAAGDVVTAIGQYTDAGALQAILVIVVGEDRGEFTLEGVIGQIVDGGVIVQETLFLLTENTLVIDAEGNVVSREFLKAGQLVVIRAQLGENGLPTAISINIVENISGEVFAKGAIEQLFDEGLVVQGRKFLVTANTRIVDENGAAISFSGLREGQIVTVIGNYTDAGELLALLVTLGNATQDDVEVEGVITAKREGGIVVKDLFFAVTDATVIAGASGEEMRYDDLAVGQFVHVTGMRAEEGMLYATKISVEPREIVVDGPIERIEGQSFFVAGFHFIVGDETHIVNEEGQPVRLESLQAGTVVLVEGILMPLSDVGGNDIASDTYLALKVLVLDDAREKIVVTGVVREAGDVRFVVDGYTFVLSDETVVKNERGEPIDMAGVEAGMLVEVTAVVGPEGVLTAVCIQLKARFQDKVSGKIEAIEGDVVVIAGVAFIVTEETEIVSVQGRSLALGDLQTGMLARALLAKRDTGELVATRMQVLLRIEDEVAVTGIVEAVHEHSLVLLGRTFFVTPNTVIVDEAGQAMRLENVPAGGTVRMRADLLPGDGLVALHITLLNEQVADIRVVGPIEDLDASTVAVMGIYFFIGADTRVFDVDGQSASLDGFRIGQTVELFAEGQPDGTRRATLIRAQDVVVAAGAIAAITDTEITLHGRVYAIDGAALVLGAENDHLGRAELKAGQYAEIRGITDNQAGKAGAPSIVTKVKVLEALEGVSIDDDDAVAAQPRRFALHQNYPNPFNPTTTIRFVLNEATPVSLTVYTLLGQEVATLVQGMLTAGEHRVEWDGTDHAGMPAASGVYLYRLQAGQDARTRQMVLLK